MSPVAPTNISGEPDFRFGDWWVRPQQNELERGQEQVHVEARSMAVLVCLARHAPAVVSRERLLREAWPDTAFVGEEVISHAVWELRKALGDAAKEPIYIQTIPRKGYRVLVEIVLPKGAPFPLEGVEINQFRLQEELGRGSMGVVHRAVDQRLGRQVAIKFLAPDLTRDLKACERFEREARLAASLDHPNLTTVFEIGETSQNQLYLVTPYYPGGSLKDVLAKGPLPARRALQLAGQIAAGLGAAHRGGIVHRDIKPANLLFDENGSLRIADFGIAKLLGATDLTRTGASLGTPAYKSPEQSQGLAVDHRTDIWSLGVVLFEMVTGRRPFDGEYEQAVVHSILNSEPQALESVQGQVVPEPVRLIVARAMAKDPKDRYQKAEEVIADLDRLTSEAPLASSSLRSRRLPKRILISLGVVAVTLALILGLSQLRGPRQAPSLSPERREAETHLDQGKICWLRGNDADSLRAAEAHFERAAELAPDWAVALAHLAIFKAERFDGSRKLPDLSATRGLIRRARALDPETPLAWAAEARLWLVSLEFDKAAKAAENAVMAEPTCRRGQSCDLAYVLLGEALWGRGQKDEAIRTLKRGTDQGDGRIRCHLKLAQLYEKAGKFAEGEIEYEKVLSWDSEQTTALNDLGLLLMDRNQVERASELFRRLFVKTGEPKAALNLGNALYAQGLWLDAEKAYQDADRIFRASGVTNPTPAVAMGDTYLEQGRSEESKTWYEKALVDFGTLLEKRSPSVGRRGQRAVCLAKLGRFGAAHKEIGEIVGRYQDFPKILCYEARILALEGRRAALFEAARRALATGLVGPSCFKDDVAFIGFRQDQDYLRILAGGIEPTE